MHTHHIHITYTHSHTYTLTYTHSHTHTHSHTLTHTGLLDPRWIEEKKKTIEERRMQEEVLAEGTNIGTSLKHLAERRTDIFGTEETVIGMKVRATLLCMLVLMFVWVHVLHVCFECVCMCVCVCVVCACMCVFVCACVFWVCVHVCACLCVCMCVLSVCACVCMCLCVVCACVCLCVCMCCVCACVFWVCVHVCVCCTTSGCGPPPLGGGNTIQNKIRLQWKVCVTCFCGCRGAAFISIPCD